MRNVRKMLAVVLAVCVAIGCTVNLWAGTKYDQVIALRDEKYDIILNYHPGQDPELNGDSSSAFTYLMLIFDYNQEMADTFCERLLAEADKGDSFDALIEYNIKRELIAAYNKSLVAEQRPTPDPLPEPELLPEGSDGYQVYQDVADSAWYAEAVNAMSEGGLFVGYDDELFHPNEYVTGGQWVTIVARLANITVPDYYAANYQDKHWAQATSSWLGYYGLSSVVPLDDLMYRGSAISEFVHAVDMDNRDFEEKLAEQYTGPTWTESDIPDWETIEANQQMLSNGGIGMVEFWDTNSILKAYNLGITHGVDGTGTCNPMGCITRAEIAQMLYNMGCVKEGTLRFPNRGGVSGSSSSSD